ncbi:MAG: dephospho-CoA kinase [Actinomycetota bacterium]|nr:dephospho-CoA kinase [Actinomycetota bacterium]
MLLGLTGGIGAGKSTALAAFAQLGCPTLSSDQIVHALYLDPEVRAAVAEHFGPGVLGEDGEVSRSALGRRVFADDGDRRWLEGLLHPRVAAALGRWREEQEAAHPGALLVHEVPLLYEAGLADRYDAVVLITAPDDLRRARRPEHFDERAATQLPEGDKAAHADHVYVNAGTPAELERWVAGVVERLRGRHT